MRPTSLHRTQKLHCSPFFWKRTFKVVSSKVTAWIQMVLYMTLWNSVYTHINNRDKCLQRLSQFLEIRKINQLRWKRSRKTVHFEDSTMQWIKPKTKKIRKEPKNKKKVNKLEYFSHIFWVTKRKRESEERERRNEYRIVMWQVEELGWQLHRTLFWSRPGLESEMSRVVDSQGSTLEFKVAPIVLTILARATTALQEESTVGILT